MKKKDTVMLEDGKEIELEASEEAKEEDIRDAREEMLLEEDNTALSLTKGFDDPNYVLYTARLNKPGWIRTLQRMGYEFVTDDELNSGKLKDSVGSHKTNIDSAARVELGINKGSDPGVVMKCPREIYEKRQKVRARINEETTKALRPTDSNIEGTLTIGGKKY